MHDTCKKTSVIFLYSALTKFLSRIAIYIEILTTKIRSKFEILVPSLFQVVNHGVSHELMSRTREAWREFFHLPLEVKQGYANSPATYEGYGSRLGVEKGIKLDWSDYFFLHLLPNTMRDQNKWPKLPLECR